MRILYHRNFEKKYLKLRLEQKEKFKEKEALFMGDPFDPVLHNHLLYGEYAGYRSIDITGDLRAHYELVSEDIALFVNIGTHHELYGK